eukprot:12673826-Alexandrium_andersonii.AAC.1
MEVACRGLAQVCNQWLQSMARTRRGHKAAIARARLRIRAARRSGRAGTLGRLPCSSPSLQ